MSDQFSDVKAKESPEIQNSQKKKITSMDFLFKSAALFVPRTGDLLEARFLARKGQNVFFDLGPFGTGIIFGREFINARDIIKKLKLGDLVAAKVVEVEGEQDCVELSLREAKQDIVWQEARELMKNNAPLELVVNGANKGGLVIGWRGLQGFLPTSQLRNNHYPRVDGGDKEKILEELRKLVGQKLTLTIITADPKEEKLIFSEKYAESEELKGLVLKYKIGDVVEGVITGVVSFGIFIKLDEGLEGLAHISELDWSLVNDPAELFSVGEKIKAKVISVEKEKISLSIKALASDPWQKIKEKYKKGDIMEGEVLRFNPYGALICVAKGVCGLVHISEFKSESDMREKLTLGKKFPFQITLFDPLEHKLTFSFLDESVEKEATKKEKKE
ncbi:MAG: S1 RNA-binding domain-containing protein [Candidatus Niyogibacteria bacterium]|nr:S1 RNA-binding domain-containing protein [Candidatus Niyogibacteria bacterium]